VGYKSLGGIHYEMENLEKAEKYFKKSMKINLKCYGENHFEVANSYEHFAKLWKKLGNLQKAEEFCKKSLTIFQHLYGENHPQTAKGYSFLANLCKNNKAEELYLQWANSNVRWHIGKNL